MPGWRGMGGCRSQMRLTAAGARALSGQLQLRKGRQRDGRAPACRLAHNVGQLSVTHVTLPCGEVVLPELAKGRGELGLA